MGDPSDDEEDGMDTSGEIRRAEVERVGGDLEARIADMGVQLEALRSAARQLSAGEEVASEVVARPPRLAESAGGGYEAYGDFVRDELEAQDKRKASFEQRGLAVITASGALVTLLFALAAFSTRRAATFELPDSAQGWLTASLILFFISAVAALVTNLPLRYEATNASAIRERLKNERFYDADAALKDIALTRVKALDSAKKKNGLKGQALIVAMTFEALAIGCVAVAISIIL